VTLVLMQELFQSQALFGDYARHWHLPLGLAIIALVALLPNGIAGLPAQWRQRHQRRTLQSPGARATPAAAAPLPAAPAATRLPIQGEPHV
jgi:branched-chain amino acid transport system permease protein